MNTGSDTGSPEPRPVAAPSVSPTDNLVYATDAIARYFTQNRVAWSQFYPSERALISTLELGPETRVLDIGCGCGGLGLALRDEFGVQDYTGVEINPPAARAAAQMNPRARVLPGDILAVSAGPLAGERFDVVFSLSCVDWNVRFTDMLGAAWTHVRPGGYFVATFRLTLDEGCRDMRRSYQFINFEGKHEGELASYVVLNARDLGEQLAMFDPAEIIASGYWGRPSVTAVTPYETLCFVALALRKQNGPVPEPTHYRLDLPSEIAEPLRLTAR